MAKELNKDLNEQLQLSFCNLCEIYKVGSSKTVHLFIAIYLIWKDSRTDWYFSVIEKNWRLESTWQHNRLPQARKEVPEQYADKELAAVYEDRR